MTKQEKPREGPRALALRVLLRVAKGKYLEPTLDLALERSALEGPDRGLATQLAYGTLQRLLYLDHALKPWLRAPGRLPEPARWILRLGTFEKLFLRTPDYATVSQWVELAKAEAPGQAKLVNAVLRRVRARKAPPWIEASIPRFLYEHWRRFFGDADFVFHFNEPPPLWVTAFPGAEEALEREGVPYETGPVPGSLKLMGGPLRALAAYRSGRIQPQNPASLFAAQLLEVPPGARVLDLAGGAGLKAAWLASQGAQVTSYDKNPRRQEAGRKNLERLGIAVAFKTADLTRPIAERAPYVLLDAPCTGTGTFRHHPELRYRIQPGDPEQMAALQRRLLETAARATLPGGRLVYAVCSLTEAEGMGVVRGFLAEHPEFVLEPYSLPFPALKQDPGAYVRPEAGLDGFFYARFRRR